MEDLEKQFFADNNDLESLFFAEPQEDTVARGDNWAGYARNIAQNIPLFGTRADEAEALARMLIYNPRDYSYEQLRKNAEESALGNIENAPYGKAVGLGTNIAGNAVLTAATMGATLLPPVSAAQGFIEGTGRGSNLEERLAQGLTDATVSFFVPKLFNKIAPTKTIQNAIIDSYAKKPLETVANDKNVGKIVVAKAIKQGTTPVDIIANEVSKGYRPTLWDNLRRSFRDEDKIRGIILKSAAEAERPLYDEYIEREVRTVAPKYSSKIGQKIKKLKLEEKGTDVLTNIDSREIAKNAVNDVMRNAPKADKQLVEKTIDNAIAKKGVAKQIVNKAVPSPVEQGINWTSLFKNVTSLPRNVSNSLLLRAMKTNKLVPDYLRGAIDSLFETSLQDSIK